MTDPIRNIIEERRQRCNPLPDETEGCFAPEPFIINETYPFGIRNHLKKSSYDYFISELDRRDDNETKRQQKYQTIMRKKDENNFRINNTSVNSRNHSLNNTRDDNKRAISLDRNVKQNRANEPDRPKADEKRLNIQSSCINKTQNFTNESPANKLQHVTEGTPKMRRNLSLDNLKRFTTTKKNVFGQDADHRHPQKPLMTSTYQNDFLKNKRVGLSRHLRSQTNNDLNTIYNHLNAQNKSAKNSFRNDAIALDDYP